LTIIGPSAGGMASPVEIAAMESRTSPTSKQFSSHCRTAFNPNMVVFHVGSKTYIVRNLIFSLRDHLWKSRLSTEYKLTKTAAARYHLAI